MKKQLKESEEDKKFIAANAYFKLYMSTLEEFVKYNGDIYLHESVDTYPKFLIQKTYSNCWVDYYFWNEFSEIFSLKYGDVESIISRWIEDTYQLKGIDCRRRK